MAYTFFTRNKPDFAADTSSQVVGFTRDNLMALRDAALMGYMPGFNTVIVVGTGTAQQPQFIKYVKSVETIRLTVTWGTSGGALNNPQIIFFEYSDDTEGTWSPIGTYTVTYDIDGEFTVGTWT